MKNGKASLKSKAPSMESANLAGMYLDATFVDDALKSELKEQNLEYHFINIKKYKDMGFHHAQWRPYKRKTQAPSDSIFEPDTEGYVKRGDLVLAVKPSEHANIHRNQLKLKAKLQSDPNKVKASELRRMMEDSGIKGRVHEGYEGEDSSSDD